MQWLAALCVKRPVFATVLILVADRRRRVLLHAASASTASRRSTSRRSSITTRAAGRRARADRDRDHRQDRGSGQHHQRHRRAALDLVRGRLAGHRSRSCSTRTSTSPRRRCATRSTASCRSCRETIEQPRVDKFDPDAAPVLSLALSAEQAGPRDHRVRRQGAAPPARERQRRRPGARPRRPPAPDQRLARRRSAARATT